MSKTGYIILAVISYVLMLPIFIGVSSYITYANYGNRTEQLIKATYENNENILSQYGEKIAEIVQVPSMYRDDLDKVTKDAISGRYGEGGSKAVFQMIKEQNPTLDSKMYTQIQEAIEAGRNDFQNAQTKEIDILRQYQTAEGNVWSGLWLKIAGYPKIDLSKYQPILTQRTQDSFKSGIDTPMNLR